MRSLGEPYHLQSASALVNTCTLRIDQQEFRQVLASQPRVGLRVLDLVAARLVRAQSDIGGQVTKTVSQRVATTLLRLADKVGDDRGRDGDHARGPALPHRPCRACPLHPRVRLPGHEPVEEGAGLDPADGGCKKCEGHPDNRVALTKVCPATSYSPTSSHLQYHRR